MVFRNSDLIHDLKQKHFYFWNLKYTEHIPAGRLSEYFSEDEAAIEEYFGILSKMRGNSLAGHIRHSYIYCELN